MTAFIKYRVTEGQEPWPSNSVKGEPLSNQEIDRNWSSVVKEIEKKANIDGQKLTGTVIVDSTTAFGLPKGTSEERPTEPYPLPKGLIRYNIENSNVEFYNGELWQSLGKVAQGGDTDEVFFLNDKLITKNYTIPTGKNALTAGPIKINSGVTVTVPDGSTWTIVGDNVPGLYTTHIGPKTITGE